MVDAAQARKQPLPDWFVNEPELVMGDEFYIKAFGDLSTCRQLGMAAGPIPWRDIILYAQYNGLDDFVTDAFCCIIRGMDNAYLAWQKAENEKNQP